MKPIIKLDGGRDMLGEGRSQGIGFGFVKKMEDGTYLGISPISPCKDYLNDVVYSEKTGKPYQACGLRTKPQAIFDDFAYLVFASCHSKYYSGAYPHYESEVKLLNENLVNTQKVLNDIENMLGIKDLTELVNADNNLVLARISKDWVSSTWMISLWSWLARNSIYSGGGEAFEEIRKTKEEEDSMSVEVIIEKIKNLIGKPLPVQDFASMGRYVHSTGIMAYKG